MDERYELLGTLGEGGMGTVYRAFDKTRGCEVALKTLRRKHGRDLFRFKREFRSLADLAHPNLVALHELQNLGGEWMFTMELVDGVKFDDWVRDRPDRLRDALGQLAEGLIALHAAGKIHRDVKPSNVLVEPSGRVVILDFGLIVDADTDDRTHDRVAVGTPAFMSPEQAADGTLTPASDWYAVGVMLYEALTGQRPFSGSAAQIIAQKQSMDPVPPTGVANSVPTSAGVALPRDAGGDLAALCMELLSRDPKRRPDGPAVLATLGRAPRARSVSHGPFVGRDRERHALEEALEASRDASQIVVVLGPSGIGKTALLRRFLDSLGGAVVLFGRCYEREAVPYKTLDGIIDGLATHLAGLQRKAGMVPDAPALSRLFPVLRRVPWLEVPTLPGTLSSDPAESRRRAMRALRALFADLAAMQPVVLAIDDLQWGDIDGAAALAELIEQPGVLVVATHRPEDEDTGGGPLAELRRRVGGHIREIVLTPLEDSEAAALWEQLGGSAGDAAVHDAAGSPLLLTEIAAARASGAMDIASVDEAVRGRVARVSGEALALLHVVAVAGRPVPLSIARKMVDLPDVDATMLTLRSERLVRVRGALPAVEMRHDRIRDAVVAAMPTAERRQLHARLAEAYLERDPEIAIDHWISAGEITRAGVLAEEVATRAEERLAFHRAADLLALALCRHDLDDAARGALHARHGRALASAGRLAEAAVELHRAAALADGRSRAELERLSVENLLKAGQLDRGLAAAAALLATVGEDLPRRPLLALLVERARLRLRGLGVVERAESEVDRSTLDHIDLLWSLASGLTFVEPILGTALHTRLLREALDAGEPRRAALALAQELAYVAMSGAPAQARLDALHAQGSALAERSGQDGVRGFVELGRGVGTYLAGRFKDGLAGIDAGAARMRKAPQDLSWQLDVGHIFRVAALWWLGDLTELRRFQEDKLRDAFDSGNVNLQRHLSSWPGAVTWIVRGEPDLAQERIDNAFNRPTLGETFNLHHFHALLGLGFADLYAGRPELAHKRTESFWSSIERTHVLRVQISNIEALFLRACAALAMGKPDLAERCAAKMWRQDVDHARALASSVRASIANARGDHQAARTAWTEARDFAEIAGMALHVAVMRWRLGDTEPANAWFVSQGVVDVERLVRMVSP